MLPTFPVLRELLRGVVRDKCAQGHVVDGLLAEVDGLPDSYDAMASMGRRLASLPMRPDWPYVEPYDLDEIWAECPAERPVERVAVVADGPARVEAGFLGSVVGCMLGKPLECDPTMDDLERVLGPLGAWPLDDYVPYAVGERLPYTLPHWESLTRETMASTAPDDDVNYTVLAMLLLERHGVGFTREDLWRLWVEQLAPGQTWGPERSFVAKAALASLVAADGGTPEEWSGFINPGEEACGALIRVDAYGYACVGHPALAAELAWRDAGMTHRRTGVYGAMWLAAALAMAPACRPSDRLGPFEAALQFVPARSRFAEVVRESLAEVRAASDWVDGYRRIHGRFGTHRHCAVYQEVGLLMNAVRFAESVGDGVCKQVMQGCDTDSFGARAGALLGLLFGPGHLEPRWLAPFHDDLRVSLALFHERSLSAVAERMGRLCLQ